ncbi:hypothetical protein B0H65DRAFT_405067, partial [Neurospora tetraspora]
ILHEAVKNLLAKLDSGQDATNEENALFEAERNWIASLNKLKAVRQAKPRGSCEMTHTEYRWFRDIHKMVKEELREPGSHPNIDQEALKKLRQAFPMLHPATEVRPRHN